MAAPTPFVPKQQVIIQPAHFGAIIDSLREDGFQVIGPTLRDGAIVYDEIEGEKDLPIGWTDVQEAGKYRLVPRGDKAWFGYNVGPQSWKRFLHSPLQRLWAAKRNGQDMEITPEHASSSKRAFVGVRSCDLHAIGVLDRVLLDGSVTDPHYAARRKNLFIIAVNCAQAGGTCFCASMNTGPKVTAAVDLRVTEFPSDTDHHFVVEAGSEAGAQMIESIPRSPADKVHHRAIDDLMEQVAGQMGRTMDTTGVKDLLYANREHPRWQQTAERCLGCANCTMVCPTCFCTTVEDVTDLTGTEAQRTRRWDSCFTMPFSYIVGGSVRPGISARYRHWLTHKLGSWWDQFGSSGCVGCGRCITWCPVGIDLTEEVRAIRETSAVSPPKAV
ncbi:MAG: 4Fe-4S dicluster domain-containing protein [Planctomycetota bacterium]